MKMFLLLILAGAVMAIGTEPRFNRIVAFSCMLGATFLMDIAFSGAAARRERERIETWLRHKGAKHIADQLQKGI